MNPVTNSQSSDTTIAARSTRAQFLIDHFLIGLLIVVAYWELLPPDKTFNVRTLFSDWLSLSQPAYTFTGRSLVDGIFPLWNTHWFAGYPHFAVPSNAVLYPATLLYGVFDFPVAAKIVVLTHVFAMACFSYRLGRDIFGARVPALFLAVTAAIGMPTIGAISAGHLWTLTTIAWMPLAFLFLRRTLLTGRVQWVLAFGLTLAVMIFAGDPQTIAFILLCFGAYVAGYSAIRVCFGRDRVLFSLRTAAMCLAAVLLGVALAGVQLIPSMEFMDQSVRRNGVTFEYLSGRLGTNLVKVFGENLFLTVDSNRVIPGKVTLALALMALVGAASPEVVAVCTAIAVCFLYADAPEWLYERLLQHVPVYNSMRGTDRIRGVITFMVYLLAAHGLYALLGSVARSRAHRGRWALAAAVAAGVVALAWVYDLRFLNVYALTGLAFALIAAAVSWRRWPMGAVALVLLSLVTLEAASRFRAATKFVDVSHHAINADYAEFSRHLKDVDRIMFVPSEIRLAHGPAVTLLTGHRNVEGYHALLLHRYAELFQAVADIPLNRVDQRGRLEVQGKLPVDRVTPEWLAVLDLLNVRHILRLGVPVPLLKYAVENGSPKFSVTQFGDLLAYTNHDALPPMFPIHEAGTVESDAFAHKLIRDGALDYWRQATLPAGTPVPPLGPATGPEPLTLRQYGPNAMEVDVILTAPALLVMSEVWYPGWYAQVDGGDPQPTLCVNTVLQATPVPAGQHRVRFFYRPASFVQGLTVSAIALGISAFAAAALVIAACRRRARAAIRSEETPT